MLKKSFFILCAFFILLPLSKASSYSCLDYLTNKIPLQRNELQTDQIARIKWFAPLGIFKPKAGDELIISQFVKEMHDLGVPVSVKTGGFSQGGQWAIENGVILDLSEYKEVSIDDKNQSVNVKSGSTWREIQEEALKYNLTTTVQQSSNIFPVGGAIGMNIHGRDIKYGSIVNVVNWIKVLRPDGKIVVATSSNKHNDLFKRVVGGLGLSGIVLEANIKLRPNKVYETVVLKGLSYKELPDVFELAATEPQLLKEYIYPEDLKRLTVDFETLTPEKIGLAYGRAQNLNPEKEGYLEKFLFYFFVEVPEGKVKSSAKLGLKNKKSLVEAVMPALMEMQRLSHKAKTVREFLEEHFMRSTGAQASLSYLLDPPVDFLLFKQREEEVGGWQGFLNGFKKDLRQFFQVPVESTDILREYFIPIEKLSEFVNSVSRMVKMFDLNNLNITYRFVPKTPNEKTPYVNYADQDMIAVVINFNVNSDEVGWEYAKIWSQRLTEEALSVGGRHYLAYDGSASLEQLLKAYPGLARIFDEILNRDFEGFSNEYIKPYLEQYKEEKLRRPPVSLAD